MKVGDLVTHAMWNAERGLVLKVMDKNMYLVHWLQRIGTGTGRREEIGGNHLEVINENR